MEIIKSIRNIRNEMKVNPGKRIEAILKAEDEEQQGIVAEGLEYIKDLARVEELELTTELEQKPDKASTAIVGGVEVILPLAGMVDLDKEIERLEKEMEDVEFEIKRAQGKLANEGFVNKAPQELVEAERKKLKEYLDKKEKLMTRLAELRS